jgi:hypothetical protein
MSVMIRNANLLWTKSNAAALDLDGRHSITQQLDVLLRGGRRTGTGLAPADGKSDYDKPDGGTTGFIPLE